MATFLLTPQSHVILIWVRTDFRIRLFNSRDNQHVGFDFNSRQHRLLRDRDRIRSGVRQPMSPVETVLGGVCAVLLGAYLIYTMLRPERF
jgi:K+-transporting ATPase KdpF subunit